MRDVALLFAKDIVLSDNQYSRLLPVSIRNSSNVSLRQKIEIQRTYVGKLGELVFLKLLNSKGKTPKTDGMFEIYKGQSEVDTFDFETIYGDSVDIKTGFRTIHSRLLVNIDQFNHSPKKYYVGVKLNAQDTNAQQKLVSWDNINSATVKGYAEYSYMKKHSEVRNFGEGSALCLPYEKLMAIEKLIDIF